MQRPSEADFEDTTIERLKLLGYEHDNGGIWRESSEFPLEACSFIPNTCAVISPRATHTYPPPR